jgi:hypothetical protein
MWHHAPCRSKKIVDALEEELQFDTQPSLLTFARSGVRGTLLPIFMTLGWRFPFDSYLWFVNMAYVTYIFIWKSTVVSRTFNAIDTHWCSW